MGAEQPPGRAARTRQSLPDAALVGATAKQAELVSLGIGEHDPARLTLADVDATGAQCEQPLQLRGLIVARWSKIEVKPVLHRLRFRYGEEKHGHRPGAGRVADLDRSIRLGIVDPAPTQHGAPEVGQPLDIAGVDHDRAQRCSHRLTVPGGDRVPCPEREYAMQVLARSGAPRPSSGWPLGDGVRSSGR